MCKMLGFAELWAEDKAYKDNAGSRKIHFITSSKFASAWQISSLALACNKIVYKPDGEYMKSPYQELVENNSEWDLVTSPHPNNATNDAVVLSAVNDIDDQNDNHTKLQQKEEIKVEQGKLLMNHKFNYSVLLFTSTRFNVLTIN